MDARNHKSSKELTLQSSICDKVQNLMLCSSFVYLSFKGKKKGAFSLFLHIIIFLLCLLKYKSEMESQERRKMLKVDM